MRFKHLNNNYVAFALYLPFALYLLLPFKIDVGGDGKQLIYQ